MRGIDASDTSDAFDTSFLLFALRAHIQTDMETSVECVGSVSFPLFTVTSGEEASALAL